MDSLICELWKDGNKQAEFELSDLNHLTAEQMDKFFQIQEDLGRDVLLKYKDSTPVLEGTSCTAQGLGDCQTVGLSAAPNGSEPGQG